MLFVVEKAKLRFNISLARDDRTAKSQWSAGPYMRMEANDDYLKLDGLEVSAKFPATVYEPGVLFLKITLFRRLLAIFKDEPFLTIQVADDELLMGYIRMPLDSNEMLLYPDPSQAPQRHPSTLFPPPPAPEPEPKKKPEYWQRMLWEGDVTTPNL
jgi:hypothetical protein